MHSAIGFVYIAHACKQSVAHNSLGVSPASEFCSLDDNVRLVTSGDLEELSKTGGGISPAQITAFEKGCGTGRSDTPQRPRMTNPKM